MKNLDFTSIFEMLGSDSTSSVLTELIGDLGLEFQQAYSLK